MTTTQPIRNKKEVRKLMDYFLKLGNLRNYVLIVLSLHTALRISDILRLSWNDVYDFERRKVLDCISISEKKTGKTKTIALNKKVTSALKLFAKEHAQPERFLIENVKTKKAISRVQAYRIIREAAESLKLSCRVSCHSLRKTFGYHAWKSGASIVIIMEIYNHSSLSVTKRYLGVTQDDKNSVYLGMDFAA